MQWCNSQIFDSKSNSSRKGTSWSGLGSSSVNPQHVVNLKHLLNSIGLDKNPITQDILLNLKVNRLIDSSTQSLTNNQARRIVEDELLKVTSTVDL